MGIHSRELVYYTCDSCKGVVTKDLAIDTPAEGYQGDIIHNSANEGGQHTFWVCSKYCLVAYIEGM